MAEEIIDADLKELTKLIKSDKLIVGTERTVKGLRAGELSKVYMSSNAPKQVTDDIMHYSKLASVSVVHLKLPNDELGTFCKKPFSISVLGIAK